MVCLVVIMTAFLLLFLASLVVLCCSSLLLSLVYNLCKCSLILRENKAAFRREGHLNMLTAHAVCLDFAVQAWN